MGCGGACEKCLRRSWLLSRLAGHLERARSEIEAVLALEDDRLIAAVGGRRSDAIHEELADLDAEALRRRARENDIELICRCEDAYPLRLRALAAPPAVLHVRGGLERFLAVAAGEGVAVVGSRQPSEYGLQVATSLGRGLAYSGVTVISGMAFGIDSAAHSGALSGNGPTVAVLPAAVESPYPRGRRPLYRQLVRKGAVVSEQPPGAAVWRWQFPARNRIVAALAAMSVVVEGDERSGALVTARIARELERPVGAVPGRVTSHHAAGPNALLRAGAHVIRGPQDVLDDLFGAGMRAVPDGRSPLDGELERVLRALADGNDTPAALARAGFPAERMLGALASLELDGYVRRTAGGRFVLVP